MDREEIVNAVRPIIVEQLFLEIRPEELGEDDSLSEKHGVDSVRLFDMIVGLEDEFEISFEDQELAVKNFDTVRAVADKILAKKQ